MTGSTSMLILKLLEDKDMYGYEMIEALARKSDRTFNLKAGTLYPILHGLESEGMVASYDESADGARVRKYYRLTGNGKKLLADKQSEWAVFSQAVQKVLFGGANYAAV